MSNIESIFKKLVNDSNEALLSSSEIKKLLDLKIAKTHRMFKIEYDWFILEIADFINQQGFTKVYNYLTDFMDDVSLKDGHRELIWNYDIFNKAKDDLYFELNNYKFPVRIIEGGLKCKFCSSMDTMSTTKQTRSGDEGAMVRNVCLSCARSWREV